MELSQEDINLIDRFNNGEQSEEELASFNERMKDPDFASSVLLYNQTIEIIRNGGREELKIILKSIQSKLEATKGFEKYNPGKSNNGRRIWSWIIGIILIIAIAFYFFLSGKIKPEEIKNFLQEKELDTVYHYIYHTDTIVKNLTDSVAVSQAQGAKRNEYKSIRKIIRVDTVYQFSKSNRQTR
jgi:predicted PurR-regulated permease PerM